ncbi:MAG: hypothetical protein P1U56_00940 [Saprospiraceae bacterium]|nr:hypothetical protein [Saprospiraceae bacterium]
MKISNLILTFILALAVSFTVQSQSNTVREIAIENDDESIYIKYEDGNLIELKVDGTIINESDYGQYETLIKKYEKNSPHHEYKTVEVLHENDLQGNLHASLLSYLSNKIAIDEDKYEFKLTPKYIKVNGKKQSKEVLSACLDIYQELAGKSLSNGSYFHVDIAKGSRSVSLSLQD